LAGYLLHVTMQDTDSSLHVITKTAGETLCADIDVARLLLHAWLHQAEWPPSGSRWASGKTGKKLLGILDCMMLGRQGAADHWTNDWSSAVEMQEMLQILVLTLTSRCT